MKFYVYRKKDNHDVTNVYAFFLSPDGTLYREDYINPGQHGGRTEIVRCDECVVVAIDEK